MSTASDAIRLLKLRSPGAPPQLTLRRLLQKHKGDAGAVARVLGLVTAAPVVQAVNALGLRAWFDALRMQSRELSRQRKSQLRNVADGYCAYSRQHQKPLAGQRECEDCKQRNREGNKRRRRAAGAAVGKSTCSVCGEKGHNKRNAEECRGFWITPKPPPRKRIRPNRKRRYKPTGRPVGRPRKYSERVVPQATIEAMRKAAMVAAEEQERRDRGELVDIDEVRMPTYRATPISAERRARFVHAREDFIALLEAAAVATPKKSLAVDLMQCAEALERPPQLGLARGFRRKALEALRAARAGSTQAAARIFRERARRLLFRAWCCRMGNG